MLTESFVAATESVKPPAAHLTSAVKDVGIFWHELQPQAILRQGYKKSSVAKNCLAISQSHVFAAQVGKAVVNVYNREKSNQESTVPFPQKISSIALAEQSSILILGTQDGKLILWEVATGRVTSSSASHIEPITSIVIAPNGDHVLSGSPDSSIHIWSIKDLVSIDTPDVGFGSMTNKTDPIATFSQHRSAINALTTNHSPHATTNFVVSASEDKVCYIWNLETLHVLRTILLTQVPQCIVLDPADRALYFGTDDGGVEKFDILSQHENAKLSILDNSVSAGATPCQLDTKNVYSTTTGINNGSSNCIAISYDGTRLLTGHQSGKVLQWEIPKQRQSGEISSLSGQSVTNLMILRPNGLPGYGSKYQVLAVVKPRLELNASIASQNSTLAIPADYTLRVQVQPIQQQSTVDTIDTAMLSSGFPQSMLDEAIQSIWRQKAEPASSREERQGSGGDIVQLEGIQAELKSLRAQVESYQASDKERVNRAAIRMKRREELGTQKRQAFFAAKKAGKNGDNAMKPYTALEDALDDESDTEAVSNLHPQTNGHRKDIDMAGTS